MIQLRNKETGSILGSISEEDLQFLVDNLEEEWEEDADYYLTRATVDMLKSRGAPETLMKLLERAIGDRDDIEIEWSRT
ncbi:MAG: galactosyldiacylglycerol synthase [Candidatus Latescibacteria bacterium]|nr:galactosyldiacylglycerol synthase [Candidatus Latescibacterota bacterium]NIO27115.1 galactosyldiacylglycerol synthase [Candidatus Latescibacterota bacterium]NIO54639.1 galactosyldiacylglycerol synthase [Candidatus Latescibacterota bacterium]NIT00722.1 galactosyldiacylglycerol synthase [Candidatus Latescibacterota bacterium]NIT37645.1 galactosyldiacylglycerol synthase [Candidatus Latescibacterota bacterium]